MKQYPVIGWREWVALPDLGVDRIKAKVDTGARTSALHAFALEPFFEDDKQKIRFSIHPIQHDTKTVAHCIAEVADQRIVTDSGGHQEMRFVIQTTLILANQAWPIEVTLTEREDMLFRMLLGRHALRKRFFIHPSRSFLATRIQSA